MFTAISNAIADVTSSFSILLGVLPSSWASIIVAALGIYLTYVVIKLILDVVSIFF